MAAAGVDLYRFQLRLERGDWLETREGRTTYSRRDDTPIAVLTVVWVVNDPNYSHYVDRDLYDRFGLRPADRDRLMLTVDLDPATAARWRTAAEKYLTAVQAAERDRHAARDHPPWFRRRAAAARARAEHREALAAADLAYEPVREMASRYLDEAYAPIAAREAAIATMAGRPIWRYERTGDMALVHAATSGGSTPDQLIAAIKREKGITGFRWEPDARAKAVELLGADGFDEWYRRFAGNWIYQLQPKPDIRYRSGGTATGGTGGFGI